jgi:protoporphyrinogen IX oxidase
MIEAFAPLVPYLKAIHILALIFWCAGLFALPIMLAWHDRTIGQADYRRIRRASHFAYTLGITPSAVISVIAGTWLILILEVYEPWLYLKLLFVAGLVAFHGWVGHTLVSVAETAGSHRPPSPTVAIALMLVPVLAILALVLGKPDFGPITAPDWLLEPRGRQLPFDVPSR